MTEKVTVRLFVDIVMHCLLPHSIHGFGKVISHKCGNLLLCLGKKYPNELNVLKRMAKPTRNWLNPILNSINSQLNLAWFKIDVFNKINILASISTFYPLMFSFSSFGGLFEWIFVIFTPAHPFRFHSAIHYEFAADSCRFTDFSSKHF